MEIVEDVAHGGVARSSLDSWGDELDGQGEREGNEENKHRGNKVSDS